MSDGMFIQLHFVVLFVMTQNLNGVIDKVITWQLDILLLSSIKEQQIGLVILN